MKHGVLLTGGTGFLGSYAIAQILRSTDLPIFVLMRAESQEHGVQRLWETLQLHLPDESSFRAVLERLVVVRGDLHAPGLGIDPALRDRILDEADSVLHIAASLNRKSPKACFNTNLRGSLAVARFAAELAERGRLSRFTNVSTSAVAGMRRDEVVHEDDAVQWSRSDYDPYARTKKFAEHLISEMLPEGTVLTLRPSSVMGDSRHDACWITDMVVAFCTMASLPVVPLDPRVRQDLVAGDWVGHGVATLHLTEALKHDVYHLSMGTDAPTGHSLKRAVAEVGQTMRFVGSLSTPFHLAMRALDRFPRSKAQRAAAVMKVFWPYMTNNVVFDNTRASEVLGPPPPFEVIAPGMMRYARQVGMRNQRIGLSSGAAHGC
ncbi:MAG: SDR family oxidoreductase [Myxococcales bacterium]|nr:SDR family oxidoreductase [Myxococcales bacterium]